MTLPPIWKIKREVTRIRGQLSRVAADFYEPPMRILHKRWLLNKARPLTGKLPLGSKVAILVVYQPNGIARSLFLTCDHLIEQGYSPFILCNMPLSEDDRTALLARAALVLERPNFGYDFGAYQDGIQLIERMGCNPDRLILMNDSTWFPLRANDASIVRMETSGNAFMGHVYKTEPKIGLGRDHMEAHFLMFNQVAQRSKEFKEFWSAYQMTSSRFNTIQRGEKGLSKTMFDAGFSSQGLTSQLLLLEQLTKEPFVGLKRMLIESSFDKNELQQQTLDLIASAADTEVWKQNVLDHVRRVIQLPATTLSTTFIYFAMTELGLGFVKKANDDFFHFTRIKVLELEADGAIKPLADEVRTEMMASVASWKPAHRSTLRGGGHR